MPPPTLGFTVGREDRMLDLELLPPSEDKGGAVQRPEPEPEPSGSERGGPPKELRVHQWLVLLSLNVIGPFASDAYMPNLPNIMQDLSTTSEDASLTIQVNWLVLGLLNPVIGLASDRFGRKKVTACSLCTFVLGCAGSALAPTLDTLMVARVVMGCGQAVSVVATAILRDLIDDPQERMRVTAIFQSLQPLAIVAAPSLGGVVGCIWGWRAVFGCLGCWGVATMSFVSTCIPESNQAFLLRKTSGTAGDEAPPAAGGEPSMAHKIYRSWCGDIKQRQALFSHGQYMRLTLTAGLFMAGVRSMLGTVSFVYAQAFCLSAVYIGFLTAVPTACGIGSGMVAGILARKHQTDALLQHGMLVGLVAPLCLVLCGIPGLSGWNWLLVAGPCAVMSATGFFVLPAMQVLVLEDFKHMSGFAAGMSKLIMTLVSTGVSMALSFFYSESDPAADGGTASHAAADCPGEEAASSDVLAPAGAAVNGSNVTDGVVVAGCEPSTQAVLGLPKPSFLLWWLCACMLATQLCYWQWRCSELRQARGERMHTPSVIP